MKWRATLCIALTALLLLPKNTAGTDIAELEPVAVLRAGTDRGRLILETDTGQIGVGGNIKEAVDDMNETAGGKVFLETAGYLLVTPSAVKWLPELAEALRPSCCVCLDITGAELRTAAEYLSIHRPDLTLRVYRQGKELAQVLYLREGRMRLGKP